MTTSKATTRVRYTHPGLAPLLWDPEVRQHRSGFEEGERAVSPAGLEVEAVEILRLNDHARRALGDLASRAPANAVAILHGRLPATLPPRELPKALRDAADLDPKHEEGRHREWINGLLPHGVDVAGNEREALHLCLVTSSGELPPPVPGQEDATDVHEQWLWHLYRATKTPPPSHQAFQDFLTKEHHFVGGIRSVPGLRGLATVGTWHDVIKPGHPASYYAGSSYSHRTLYADAFALAKLQDIVLDAFNGELAHLARSEPHRRRIFRLERDLLVFQRTYWASGFGKNLESEAILRRWQQEAELASKVQSLREDLTELSRQVQTSDTETTNAILGLIAAIGLPMATGLAIWAGLPAAGAASLRWTLLPVGVTILAFIAAVPGLRRLTLDAFRRRDRRS